MEGGTDLSSSCKAKTKRGSVVEYFVENAAAKTSQE